MIVLVSGATATMQRHPDVGVLVVPGAGNHPEHVSGRTWAMDNGAAMNHQVLAWHLNATWACVCNRGDGVFHSHYREDLRRCARCGECDRYRPDMPESVAIAILIGLEMTETQAADALLGKQEPPHA